MPFLRDAWRLALPYFLSEEKWSARGLLGAIIALNLSLVGMNAILSFWNRQFFNALQDKDFTAFVQLLFLWRRTPDGFMPGFCGVAAVYILAAIHCTYLNQWLQIRWRRWMTDRFLNEWMTSRAYYRISLTVDPGAIGTDNPDQRIAEDLRDFVDSTLALALGLLSNIVSLFSFIGILWGLSGAVTLLGITIPGYMVWVALIYAALGTWLTHLVGRPLVGLNFRQQRVEADFRYALVRFRENVEGVALYGGEGEERHATSVANSRLVASRRPPTRSPAYRTRSPGSSAHTARSPPGGRRRSASAPSIAPFSPRMRRKERGSMWRVARSTLSICAT
jgi:putative ATP-binding cassette transporter